MKVLLLVPILSLITGCAAIDAFKTRPFDNIEQDKINYIRTLSGEMKQQCSSPNSIKADLAILKFKALELKNYSNSLPDNQETAKLSVLLFNLIEPMSNAYQLDDAPGETFCKLKLDNIEESAKKIQLVNSKRPK